MTIDNEFVKTITDMINTVIADNKKTSREMMSNLDKLESRFDKIESNLDDRFSKIDMALGNLSARLDIVDNKIFVISERLSITDEVEATVI